MRAPVVVALLAVLTLAGCTPSAPEARPPAHSQAGASDLPSPGPPSSSTESGACRSDYVPATLPTWARIGFTPPTEPMPHVLGDNGDIVAILWAEHDPLQVPPAADRKQQDLVGLPGRSR